MLNGIFVENFIFNGELTPTGFKLIIFLLTIIEDGKTLRLKRLTHAEMADHIKANRTNVTVVVNQLNKAGIIIKKNRDYYFNHELFCDFEQQKKA